MWRTIVDKPFVLAHIGITVCFITATDWSLIAGGRGQVVAENSL